MTNNSFQIDFGFLFCTGSTIVGYFLLDLETLPGILVCLSLEICFHVGGRLSDELFLAFMPILTNQKLVFVRICQRQVLLASNWSV